MNRKIYLWGIATIIALFFTSCSQTEPENLSNEAEVTFTLDIENAIATRAISDGTGANQITFAISMKTAAKFSHLKHLELFQAINS